MRTLFLLKAGASRNGSYPTGEDISTEIFAGAGWNEESVNNLASWDQAKEYYVAKAKYLFDPNGKHLPESIRLHESEQQVIFYGTANKAEIVVTKINQTETYVRIIHNDLKQLQETTEIVVKTIRDRFQTVKDSKISVAHSEVLILENGVDHKIIKGKVLHKDGIFKTAATVKKYDKGNYYLFLVSLSLCAFAILFDLASHTYFNDFVQFADRALLAFIAVLATPLARFLQSLFEIMNSKIIKWVPFSEPDM